MEKTKRVDFARKLAGKKRDSSWRDETVRRIMEEGGRPAESRTRSRTRANAERRPRPGEKCWPSVCFSCQNSCEVLVYTDERTGRVLRVEGDPDSPQTNGWLCSKGLASPDLCYNPERLHKPLRRAGPRGSGKFEEISWDEALDTVAGK